ncbi:hypothetical protein DOM22_09310 [Bdellovibrio sp. ZAP7]|uniref:GNAT family N-acetyltransferase n=1 Tax=Bdellovibrio sp. ZAP7 TaxID=2231053 RepID=UPI001156DF6E|nr:GNAT family N-acetyltransferase [Bdellovibrio sp. ZAP7]QDK45336.1 hypothetical protein DOM22_09310 [Bdellovibrio sp. ZAP7]
MVVMLLDHIKVTKLEWDSHFFEKGVYIVETSDFSALKEYLSKSNEPALYYLFSNIKINELSDRLMDHKMTYAIDVKGIVNFPTPNSCVFYDGKNARTAELEHLAVLSSRNSRFRTDDLIPKNKVDELFKMWIGNALKPNPATKILLKHIDGKVAGMVSFRPTPDLLKIELVAVREDFQRRGCAAEMLKACIGYAQDHSIKRIEVVTQEVNKGACELYVRAGFKLVDSKYIYHVHTT